jgi:hypothetical protein
MVCGLSVQADCALPLQNPANLRERAAIGPADALQRVLTYLPDVAMVAHFLLPPTTEHNTKCRLEARDSRRQSTAVSASTESGCNVIEGRKPTVRARGRQEHGMEEQGIAHLSAPYAGCRCLIASAYLAGTNMRRVRRALKALLAEGIGKEVVSRVWQNATTNDLRARTLLGAT